MAPLILFISGGKKIKLRAIKYTEKQKKQMQSHPTVLRQVCAVVSEFITDVQNV